MLSRRAVLKGLLLLPLAGCTRSSPRAARSGAPAAAPPTESPVHPADSPDAALILRRACNYLWSKQADDAGWHSETYGLMRSGQAYTPFILHTLLQVPEDIGPRQLGGVARALDFIRRHTSDAGVIGLADPDAPEYPNYSTAYALRCLVRAGNDADRPRIARLRAHLESEQFRDTNGFPPDSPAHGGWGFGGRRPPGSTGHMDLAHTRHVLESLCDAGTDDAAVFALAQIFLRYVQRHPDDQRPQPPFDESQPGAGPRVPHVGHVGGYRFARISFNAEPQATAPNERAGACGLALNDLVAARPPYDGGFYFSPIVLDANKGRVEPGTDSSPAYFRSYATATCDGVLSLLAAGVPPDDERVVSARCWLQRHPRLDYPEGIPLDHPEPWGAAVQFYHFAVRSEADAALNWPGDWRHELTPLLAARQRPDGSFINTASHLMKEDDPLLATALAAIALTHAVP